MSIFVLDVLKQRQAEQVASRQRVKDLLALEEREPLLPEEPSDEERVERALRGANLFSSPISNAELQSRLQLLPPRLRQMAGERYETGVRGVQGLGGEPLGAGEAVSAGVGLVTSPISLPLSVLEPVLRPLEENVVKPVAATVTLA